MIDLQGRPAYTRGDCPICKNWKAIGLHKCQECQAAIPRYGQTMGGNGFESQTIDHWHFRTVISTQGFSAVTKELCIDCYRTDWKQVYSEEAVPV